MLGIEGQLVSALRNLIANAITYSGSGSRVAVATRVADGLVEISVSDQGIGIAPEDQARIFERFYRVDQARSRDTGGTGLGLSIVKHIVQLHGGRVWAESEPGKGAAFFLRLPRRTAAGDERQARQRHPGSSQQDVRHGGGIRRAGRSRGDAGCRRRAQGARPPGKAIAPDAVPPDAAAASSDELRASLLACLRRAKLIEVSK